MSTPARMAVEAGKVREFAAATGSSHVAYASAEPTSSPATFLIAKRFWQAPSEDPWATLDLDPRRMLHAEEAFEFFGPPPAPGTELWFLSAVEGVVTKPGRRGGSMRFVTVATDFADGDGTLRARTRTTVVETAKAPEPAVAASDESRSASAAAPAAPAEPVVGFPALPEPREIGPITRTDFVRYQGASGDMNPIHHDEPFAVAAGFPSVFAPGMWVAGLLGTYATDWMGPDRLRSFRVRFARQVWPGDALIFSAEAAEQPDPECLAVVLHARSRGVTAGAETEAVTAWATFAHS